MAIKTKTLSSKHRFFWFIFSSLLIASGLVITSMFMYNSSGTMQLDLSRPGYVNIRSQAVNDNSDMQDYSGDGPINQATINEFKVIYNKQSQKVKSIDAFGGDTLNPDSLGIGSSSVIID